MGSICTVLLYYSLKNKKKKKNGKLNIMMNFHMYISFSILNATKRKSNKINKTFIDAFQVKKKLWIYFVLFIEIVNRQSICVLSNQIKRKQKETTNSNKNIIQWLVLCASQIPIERWIKYRCCTVQNNILFYVT